MRELFQSILSASEEGGGVLASIVAASGSAPRGVGAKMLVWPDGAITGTIGGGAVEHRARQLAATMAEGRSAMVEYALTPNQAADIGMVCGGTVRVFLEPLLGEEEERALFASAVDYMQRGVPCALVTQVGEESCRRYLWAEDSPFLPPPEVLEAATLPVLQTATLDLGGAQYILEPLVSGERVLVFGGGHVGRELSAFLRRLGYDHMVVDDREEFTALQQQPWAHRTLCREYEGAVEALAVTALDDIVIMTRGHLHDYTLLRQALTTPARYIGMIGSRKKVEAAFEKLREEGFTRKDIDRVHAPIGLDLGGKTPAEVALSVAAQLVALRSGK